MPEENTPPTKTFLAAAAGGFAGAVLGVVAAGAMANGNGGGNGTGGQAALEAAESQVVEIVASAD